MKKLLFAFLIIGLVFTSAVYADEVAIETPVEVAITNAATFVPVTATGISGFSFLVRSRGGYDFYISDVPAGTTYYTWTDGQTYNITFHIEKEGVTFFYAKSANATDTLEIMAVQKK